MEMTAAEERRERTCGTIRMGLLPCLAAGVGLAAVVYALVAETKAFRATIGEWAARDLAARTELATEALAEPLATGDFRRIRLFGDECRAAGVRLTVLSIPGGMIFDTLTPACGDHGRRPEVAEARRNGMGIAFRKSETTGEDSLYCARAVDRGFVRLAIPQARVFAPVERTRTTILLAGLVGACGILLLFLFMDRLLARNRALARERDIQARKLAELHRAEEFRRQFVSDVTHEIKTPLTGILAAVDLLQEGERDARQDAEERRTLLDMIRKESSRLNNLVGDVLSLAQIEQSPAETPHEFAPAALDDIVREAAGRMKPRADAAGIALKIEANAPMQCVCDAQLVGQAIENLVENAVRYSGSNEVSISLHGEGDRAVIAVEDHGVGIPPEHRDHIFERFYRVDKARSREQGGTGLGLAIVKHIAMLHGGEAALSDVAGGGCRFTISMPLEQKQTSKGKE
ncbi:MAG: hypothetical protein IKO72_02415 [Kiritimatiellae bacterium]|nr:hypothetical protein [Kiritimatiellia bacterium]